MLELQGKYATAKVFTGVDVGHHPNPLSFGIRLVQQADDLRD